MYSYACLIDRSEEILDAEFNHFEALREGYESTLPILVRETLNDHA
jgi:hypothetical protein